MTRCEGVFVTCGEFTQDAIAFAADKPIRLINGRELLAMIASTNPVRPPVNPPAPVAAGAPANSRADAAPTCPDCGVAMVRRVASRGAHAGQVFWGCRNYPRCRRVLDATAA